jgi:hypothetical protein
MRFYQEILWLSKIISFKSILTLDSEVIIAEIEDDALLGLDILMKGEGGPADIKLTEGIILS